MKILLIAFTLTLLLGCSSDGPPTEPQPIDNPFVIVDSGDEPDTDSNEDPDPVIVPDVPEVVDPDVIVTVEDGTTTEDGETNYDAVRYEDRIVSIEKILLTSTTQEWLCDFDNPYGTNKVIQLEFYDNSIGSGQTQNLTPTQNNPQGEWISTVFNTYWIVMYDSTSDGINVTIHANSEGFTLYDVKDISSTKPEDVIDQLSAWNGFSDTKPNIECSKKLLI